MPILEYPNFLPLSLDMRPELHPALAQLEDGISEYTFAGLYLFRNTYQYNAAWLPPSPVSAGGSTGHTRRKLVLRGQRDGKTFYAFPFGLPDDLELRTVLLSEVDYVKGLPEKSADSARIWAEQNNRFVWEDRDNFDYLYLREDLASLSGKKYHKKRNHVNAFINNYEYEEQKFCNETIADTYKILETWRSERDRDDDYHSSKEALDLCEELELCGYIVHANGKPAGYTLGEGLQNGKTFCVHMEKGLSEFKGIYQFINMSFAAILPKHYEFINREQDLGNPGLRQSKMTYLPSGFVKKYRIYPQGAELPVSPASQMVPGDGKALVETAGTPSNE